MPRKSEALEDARDVAYFRKQLKDQSRHLTDFVNRWKQRIHDAHDIPEEAQGEIRMAIGKAELLMRQRFRQFQGLIDDCEFRRGEKETRCEDLQGFWDMIFFQIEDVCANFGRLETMQRNQWKDPKETPVVPSRKSRTVHSKKPGAQKATPKSRTSSGHHSQEAKQRLESAKENILLESSSSCESVKVFEMPGFFTINSPIRTVHQSSATRASHEKKSRTAEKSRHGGGSPRKQKPRSQKELAYD